MPEEKINMSTREKLIEAQCSKVSSLADFENLIGDLYEIYATLFPDMAAFWQSIVKEERKHAKLLISMTGLSRDGHIFYNLDMMDTKSIEQYVSVIKANITAARQDSLKPRDAIVTALSIEASVVEADFYKDVKSDAPEFQVIAHHLIKDTQRHADLIEEELKKHLTLAQFDLQGKRS
jgi:hypothetical protein